MLHLVTLMMSVSSFVPPAVDLDRLLTSPTRHVRALSADLAAIVQRGVRRSRTFAQLVARLDRSDVIVQIVSSNGLKPSIAGRLLLGASANGWRFVRIEVRAGGTEQDLVTVLAHELRHAVEIADAPWVRDADALSTLYRRIGHGSPRLEGFDTDAAVDAGRQVRAEMSSRF